MSQDGSDALVAAARTGDQSAWHELYRLHAARLAMWLRSLPQSDWASSPDDIAAEAWLTVATKVGEFRGSDDDFAGWLFTIARLHAANSSRKAQRRQTDPVAVESGSDATWGLTRDDYALVDEQDTMRRLLAHLSQREAEVVACIDVVGLDVASTAQALGMKPTAVRVARHRALGRLRRIIASEEQSSDP